MRELALVAGGRDRPAASWSVVLVRSAMFSAAFRDPVGGPPRRVQRDPATAGNDPIGRPHCDPIGRPDPLARLVTHFWIGRARGLVLAHGA